MGRKLWWATFGGLVLLGVGACTNSDVLRTDAGNASLVVQVSPAGSTRYEQGAIQIKEVTIRPVDPQADAALGPEPITFISTSFSADLTTADSHVVGTLLLNEGDYRVIRIILGTIRIADTTPPDAHVAPASCLDAVLGRPDVHGQLPPPGIVVADTAIDFVAPQPVFHVGPNGGTLKLVIDGAQLFTRFEAAFQQCRPARCQSSPGTLCTVDTQCPPIPDVCVAATSCQSDSGRPCTVDADCARNDACLRTGSSCGSVNTPCLGVYQPLTVNQLLSVVSFE